MKTWYTTVSFGSGPYAMPPRGPWRSIAEAEDAIERWEDRVAHLAGTIRAAHSVRLVGPYRTRHAARQADISTAPVVARGWDDR